MKDLLFCLNRSLYDKGKVYNHSDIGLGEDDKQFKEMYIKVKH